MDGANIKVDCEVREKLQEMTVRWRQAFKSNKQVIWLQKYLLPPDLLVLLVARLKIHLFLVPLPKKSWDKKDGSKRAGVG